MLQRGAWMVLITQLMMVDFQLDIKLSPSEMRLAHQSLILLIRPRLSQKQLYLAQQVGSDK
jgi:hypothetical protein